MGTNRYNINMARVLFIVLILFSFSLACNLDAHALTINSGASSTNIPGVSLQLNMPANTYKIDVSNEGGSVTTYNNPSSTIPWTLSAGDGLKTVTVTYYYYYYYQYQCGTYACGSYCCSTDRALQRFKWVEHIAC